MKPFAVVVVLAAAAGVFAAGQSRGLFQARQEEPRVVPAPDVDAAAGTAPTEVAVLAGGCFWGVQGVFQHVKGVDSAISGYSGGMLQNPRYEDVITEKTGCSGSTACTASRTEATTDPWGPAVRRRMFMPWSG